MIGECHITKLDEINICVINVNLKKCVNLIDVELGPIIQGIIYDCVLVFCLSQITAASSTCSYNCTLREWFCKITTTSTRLIQIEKLKRQYQI